MRQIGINFHEGLQLSRSRLAATLRFFSENPGASRDQLRSGTDLGANMVVAFPNLAVGCGLLEEGGTKGGRVLTDLGNTVINNDPYLEGETSRWLIHYGLVDPAGRGPAYWGRLMLDVIRPGGRYQAAELASSVGEFESVVREKVQLAVGKLTESYASDGFLGALGLLEKKGSEIHATFPMILPSACVFSYAVASRWSHLLKEQVTTSLETFLVESRLPEIFRMPREQCVALLEESVDLGLVDLYRTATPHQIVRKWKATQDLLATLY